MNYSKLVSALRTRNQQAELEEDPINIPYGILNQIVKVLDEEDISAKQITPSLATLSEKVKMLLQTLSKNHITFLKKAKNYLKKTQIILRN